MVEIHYPLIFELAHRGLTWLGLVHGFGAVPLEKPTCTRWRSLPGSVCSRRLSICSPAGNWMEATSCFPSHRTCIQHLASDHSDLDSDGSVFVDGLAGVGNFAGDQQLPSPPGPDWPKVSGVRSWLALSFAVVMLVLTLIPKPVATIEDGHDRSSLKALIRGR